MKKSGLLPLFILFAFIPGILIAQITLPSFFGDHMVLQQEEKVQIWGWDTPGQKIIIRADWGSSASAQADEEGKWATTLQTPSAGGPFEIRISGSNEVSLNDVMIGEVWICSGQSNMVMTLRSTYRNQPTHNGLDAILAANQSRIRMYTVANEASLTPKSDTKGNWKTSTTENAANFSAVAWYFGKMIEDIIDVPVGLIVTAWGGSRIEAWMDETTLRQSGKTEFPDKVPEKAANHTPTLLYNGMIKPLVPFTARGFLWYQGESNVSDAHEYSDLFDRMIESWRNDFENKDMPFYFAEIAPFDYHGQNSAYLREAQLQTMQKISNTGMANTIDLGNCTNIHPGDKENVGKRLALWALANTYGLKGFQYSGPVYKEMEKTEDHKIKLSFDHADYGLYSLDQPLAGFEISDQNGQFFPAKAEITGKGVTVWSEQVQNPQNVRYAFSNCPEANLYNMDGLPASSFRTDTTSSRE